MLIVKTVQLTRFNDIDLDITIVDIFNAAGLKEAFGLQLFIVGFSLDVRDFEFTELFELSD